jgi:hypothetical protein
LPELRTGTLTGDILPGFFLFRKNSPELHFLSMFMPGDRVTGMIIDSFSNYGVISVDVAAPGVNI